MSKTPNFGKGEAEARILASAAGMFANFGYNSVSTRDIASGAGVNEVTIYRHYPRKRDLYVAVLDAELQQVKLRGDLLSRVAEAQDARTAVARAGVTRKRALIRARDLLWRVNAPVAGVVVNDVDMRLENFYTYRYGMYAKDYWYGYGYRHGASSSSRAYGYEDEEKGE